MLPSVRSIGAGTVVAHDVTPYAIGQGNPGRVIGYRFSPEKIRDLLAERCGRSRSTSWLLIRSFRADEDPAGKRGECGN